VSRLRFLTNDTFRSLSVRNFRLFFIGQLISQIGNWSTLTIQTLLVLHLTHNGVAVGLLAAAQFGPVLLFAPWAGVVADRSDKRRLLLIVQSLAMVQSFALAALGFMHQPPLAAIYLVAIAGGFTTAFDNPTRRAFVVEMVPETEINNAVSLNSALMTGSRVVGPALGGALVLALGFGWAFLFDGISYLAVLAGLLMMNVHQLRRSPVASRGKGQVREGLRYVRQVPELWVSLTMMAVIGTLAFNFQTTLPLFSTRDLNGSDTSYTLLLSTLSLGSFLGALVVARRTRIDLRVVSTSALAFGAALLALSVMPTASLAFPVGFLVGLSSIAFMTASTAIVQLRADPMMRGRVLALQALVFLGSTPIGGPIMGVVSETVGARWALAIGAVGTLATGAAGWVYYERAHVEAAPEERAPAFAVLARSAPLGPPRGGPARGGAPRPAPGAAPAWPGQRAAAPTGPGRPRSQSAQPRPPVPTGPRPAPARQPATNGHGPPPARQPAPNGYGPPPARQPGPNGNGPGPGRQPAGNGKSPPRAPAPPAGYRPPAPNGAPARPWPPAGRPAPERPH
jgi:MFS family permease